jgi:class 3 adenylate cyclase/tetratricopeptide (TPR) repeat protein
VDSPRTYTPKHLADRILASRSAFEGERKQVTVLFCDIVGSTAMADRLGPEAMHKLLTWFFELATVEVHRYEGTVNQFLGDGFMALFGAPLALEDHVRRAVLASLAIQKLLRERGAELGLPIELAVRMGLNTGAVVVGAIGDNLRMDYTAVGDTTHLAARLQQLAEPGTICLSEETYRVAREYFDCLSVGKRTVKGKGEPVNVYRVLGLRQQPRSAGERPAPGIRSPLVGRDREVQALHASIARLMSGRGGLVSVIGEAGLGKSRLVAEVRRQTGDASPLWLEGRGLPFSRMLSYWPFQEVIKHFAGIAEEDDSAASWANLQARLSELFGEQTADVLPYLAALLTLDIPEEFAGSVRYLDGDALRRQVFRSARRFFERLAVSRPVVLVFEDLQWIDESSAELLEHLAPLTRTVPLLLCAAGRPGGQTPVDRFRRVGAGRYADLYSEIVLSPLPGSDSARLVQNLLGMADTPPRIRELVLGKAEGNPFFVEEMVRALVDMRALVRDRETGALMPTAHLERVPIPGTIQGIVTARVDRLEEDAKQILKHAAVIGRTFLYRVLRMLGEDEQGLERCLDVLQGLELIRERRRTPELEYIFKHVLVQEAVYETMLADRRRQLHRRVAECIEALFEEHLDEWYGLLAFHYAQAAEWEKAQGYLLKAGDQAGRLAADAEALAHYEHAMRAYARAFGERWDPLERAILERKMGEARFRRGEHQQAKEHLRRALGYLKRPFPASPRGIRVATGREILVQLSHRLRRARGGGEAGSRVDPVVEECARIYWAMGWIDFWVDPDSMVLDALKLLNVSEQGRVPVGTVQGLFGLGFACDHVGRFRLARYYHRRAVALAEEIRHPFAIGVAYIGLGWHEHNSRGDYERAGVHYRRAAEAYRGAGDLRRWAAATMGATWMSHARGAFAESIEQNREILRVGQEAADHQAIGWGLLGLGRAESLTGALEQAQDHLQAAIELFRGVPDFQSLAFAGGELGQCYLRQGEYGKAISLLEESEDLIVTRRLRGWLCTSPRIGLAEVYLIAAEQAAGAERSSLLEKAGRACRRALRQSRIDRGGLAASCRLWGTYEWQRGRRAAAERWWRRSLAVAEAQGARYELGRTCLETGRRTGDAALLQRASALFAEVGAVVGAN